MTETALAIAFMSELLSSDQQLKASVARQLPKGMELSHFSVLNHLYTTGERTPAQLAKSFQLTKGAMTNTVKRLEAAGYISVRPDWDDARRKWVSISPAGRQARDIAINQLEPVFQVVVDELGADKIKATLPVLRAFRAALKS
ncbi:MAG: MarR family transcriptional regulator [Pseudomonadota bacterium]